MDVQINVPQTPVVLVTGAETRVGVRVCNHTGATTVVRLSVAPNRAGAWAHIDPAIVEVADGECADAEVVFRPPADAPHTSHLLPYTVRAEDLQYAVTAGRVTGLVTLAEPERLHATLTRQPAGRGGQRFALGLTNRADEPLTVRIRADLHPPRGRVQAQPSALDLAPRGTAVGHVQVRPRRPVVGSAAPYTVVVSCRDAVADDAVPLVTVEETGTIRPRIGRWPATALAIALLVLAVGAVVLRTGPPGLPGVRDRPTTPPVADVRPPYALLEVYPRQDRAAAEAALSRLTAAGAPARLVDGASSAVIGDEVLVILQDGLASVPDGEAYCDRIRVVAPKCKVFG